MAAPISDQRESKEITRATSWCGTQACEATWEPTTLQRKAQWQCQRVPVFLDRRCFDSPERAANTDERLSDYQLSPAVDAILVDEKTHADDLDAETDDLEQLVSMSDSVYGSGDNTARA